ncbi:trimeric intracellular cation channel family protein [Fodinicurvata sp. EGI_FJ10296]|uniref:trimeric intracellular cation channel family protein n=1 Tax=Fodinicurvata sp. EGI_FJ10296 TaxID=3231908 RepID=UPI0034521FCE
MGPIFFLDYVGVALFAATGALAASRQQLDIVGFLFLSAVTGIGGGTARDLILGVPVFWVEQPVFIPVCAATAVLVYFAAHLIESRHRLLLWLDAVALSAYGVFGAYKGLAVTDSATVAVVMGMITGTLGGILRDVLASQPSVLMRPEIYVAAAMAGAVTFVAVYGLGLPLILAAGSGFLVALGIRSGALYFGWTFPRYRSRPGRTPTEAADKE